MFIPMMIASLTVPFSAVAGQPSPAVAEYEVRVSGHEGHYRGMARVDVESDRLLLFKDGKAALEVPLMKGDLSEEADCWYSRVHPLTLRGRAPVCARRQNATIRRSQVLAMARVLIAAGDGAHELLDRCQYYDSCKSAKGDLPSWSDPLNAHDTRWNEGVEFRFTNMADGRESLIVWEAGGSRALVVEFQFKRMVESL